MFGEQTTAAAVAAPTKARAWAFIAVVFICCCFCCSGWANAQSGSCSSPGAYSTAVLANLTAGSYNAAAFPGSSATVQCMGCGGSSTTSAYLLSGSSANGALNSVLVSPSPGGSAFPYLQCLGGLPTCVCNSTRCYSLVGGLPGVYLLPYCSGPSACQVYGVLDCFVGGALAQSASQYFSGTNYLVRYSCAQQVLANHSWASLAGSGLFPLVTYVKCGLCPAIVPTVTPASCTGNASTPSPTGPTACVIPQNQTASVILDIASDPNQLYNTQGYMGYCSCSSTANAPALSVFGAGPPTKSMDSRHLVEVKCDGDQANLCVCAVNGSCYAPFGSINSEIGAQIQGNSICDASGGCFIYIWIYCEIENVMDPNSGLKDIVTGANYSCSSQYTNISGLYGDQLVEGTAGSSSFIRAAYIGCNTCSGAQSVLAECQGANLVGPFINGTDEVYCGTCACTEA